MLPKEDLRPWMKSVMLFGYEDENPQGGAPTEGDPGEGGEGEDPTDDAEDLGKLQRALKAERLRSKNLEKKLRDASASRGADEDADEETEEGEQEPQKPKAKGTRSPAAKAAEEKLEKLRVAFVKNSFATTVKSLASNFVDPDDAVAALDMSLVNHEQDDDDPSNIVWDEAEIKTALKDLAKRKPHFLKTATAGDGKGGKTPSRPSGSKFGGAGKPSTTDTKAQQADFARRFPAMRNVRPPQ